MSSRIYDNRSREEAAQLTRRRIVESARRLFLERGYAATAVNDIARAAGVSPQTVYSRVGGKAAVLKAVYDITLAGDDDPVPMAERPEFRRMVGAVDAAALFAAYATVARALLSRLRPLLVLVHGARAVEPDLDELARTGAAERRAGAEAFAANTVARGFTRAGLSEEAVVELVWVLNSPEAYLLLVREGGLDDDGYERWLARALTAALT